MEPIDYLKRIRERWRFIATITVLALVAGAGAGFLVSRKESKKAYAATTKLVQEGSTQSGSKEQVQRQNTQQAATTGTNLRLASAYLKLDPVVSGVANGLDLPTGQKPPGKVAVQYNGETNQLAISVTSFDAEAVKETADLYAQSLIAYLKDNEVKANAAEAATLSAQIEQLGKEIASLDHKIAKFPAAAQAASQASSRGSGSGSGQVTNTGSPADPLIAQRGAALVQLSVLASDLQKVKARVPDAGGIIVLEPATVTPIAVSQKRMLIQFPMGAIIAGILGLLFAMVITLVRERLNGHVRSKEAVERSFGFPVLAEIPLVRMSGGNHDAALPSEGNIRAADAFRLLTAALTAPGISAGEKGYQGRGRSRTILVTSSGPGEGTSTMVAELASTFAQSGKQVLILSCDFRNPGVHRYFGIPNENGLAEALLWQNGDSVLGQCLRPTPVLGVYVVPSGAAVARPNELLALASLRRAFSEARLRADVVLIDTPPILTSDVTFLLPEVATVLVVARAGKTSQKTAIRSANLLRQLGAPVSGVVLNGSGGGGLPNRYYQAEGWGRRMVHIAATALAPVRWVGRAVARIVRPLAPVFRPVARILRPVARIFRPVARILRPVGSVVAAPVRRIAHHRKVRDTEESREISLDGPGPSAALSSNGENGSASQPRRVPIDVAPGTSTLPADDNGKKSGRRGFPRLSRRSSD